MTSHDIVYENYVRLIYYQKYHLHLAEEQTNLIRCLVQSNRFSYERANQVQVISFDVYEDLVKVFKLSHYQFLTLELIQEIDCNLIDKEKQNWTESNKCVESFFESYPNTKIYKSVLTTFNEDFSALFNNKLCVDSLFRLYQVDKSNLKEYQTFLKKQSHETNGVADMALFNGSRFFDLFSIHFDGKNGKIMEYQTRMKNMNFKKYYHQHESNKRGFEYKNSSIYNEFFGYLQLNLIQECVLEVIEKNNDNIILCAPTSSGKTLVAIMAIIKCLKTDRNARIFYIAPIKALIRQIAKEINCVINKNSVLATNISRFSILEVTADSDISIREIRNAHICVGTPEKLDMLLRRGLNYQLVIIDEVHLLNSERGDVLEGIVSRIDSRIIGLSATIPHFEEVRQFIRSPRCNTLYFDNTFRAIKIVYEYNLINLSDENQEIAVQRALTMAGPTLFFVNKRSCTLEIADKMVLAMKNTKNKDTENEEYKKNLIDKDNSILLDKITDEHILRLISNGICIHHAGLLKEDKIVIEELFKRNVIRILVSTTTLAWGINMPCNTVIIYGTFTSLEIIQMCGRAGRSSPVQTKSGVCAMGIYYGPDVGKMKTFENDLINRLDFHLISGIKSGQICCIGDALKWFKRTFHYHKIVSAIGEYVAFENELREYNSDCGNNIENKTRNYFNQIKENIADRLFDILGNNNYKKVDQSNFVTIGHRQDIINKIADYIVERIVFSAISKLNEINLMKNFTPTILGVCSHKYYIDVCEIIHFKKVNKFYTRSLIFELLGMMFELPKIQIPDIQVPYPTESKFSQMVQFLLAGHSFPIDAVFIIKNIQRVLSGLYEYLLYKKFTVLFKVLSIFHMFEHTKTQITTNKGKRNKTKNQLNHFCEHNYPENIFYNDVKSSYKDIFLDIQLYRKNDALDLDILFYIENIKNTTREIYLDNISDRFLHFRIISSDVNNIFFRQVLVKEVPILPENILTRMQCEWMDYDNTISPKFDCVVTKTQFCGTQENSTISYELFNEIIWGDGCTMRLDISHPSHNNTSSKSNLLPNCNKVNRSEVLRKKIMQGTARILLADMHLLEEDNFIQLALYKSRKLKFNVVCIGKDVEDLKNRIYFSICYKTIDEDALAEFVGEIAGNLHHNPLENKIVILDSDEIAKKCLIFYKEYEIRHIKRDLESSVIFTNDLSNRANIIFTSNSNLQKNHGHVHLVTRELSLYKIKNLKGFFETLTIYSDVFSYKSIKNKIQFLYQNNMSDTKQTPSSISKRHGDAVLETDGGLCKEKNTEHFNKTTVKNHEFYFPSDTFLLYLNTNSNITPEHRIIIMRYSLSVTHFNILIMKIKSGTSIKQILEVLLGIYHLKHPEVMLDTEEFINGILESNTSQETKCFRGKMTESTECDPWEKFTDKKCKINGLELKNIIFFLRKYLNCLMEICANTKNFKTLIVSIYTIQKLHCVKYKFYTIDWMPSDFEIGNGPSAHDKTTCIRNMNNESLEEIQHNRNCVSLEDAKDESLNAYIKLARQKMPDQKNIIMFTESFKKTKSSRIKLVIKELVSEELTYFFISEFYDFKRFHFNAIGTYFIEWVGPVYVACDFGSGIEHLDVTV